MAHLLGNGAQGGEIISAPTLCPVARKYLNHCEWRTRHLRNFQLLQTVQVWLHIAARPTHKVYLKTSMLPDLRCRGGESSAKAARYRYSMQYPPGFIWKLFALFGLDMFYCVGLNVVRSPSKSCHQISARYQSTLAETCRTRDIYII